MDLLITGGAGFLGSHLCEYFVSEGYNVACYDNFVTGQLENLESVMDEPNFDVVNHDVTEYIDPSDTTVFKNHSPGIILHFASLASPEDYRKYPIKTLKVGSLGTHRALGVAKKYDSIFLLASTSEVYGDPLEHPQSEDYPGNVDPLGDRGVYDESKRFAEAMTMAYHRNHDVDTRIARIFNTYGPRMRLQDGRVVPNFFRQALRGDPLTVYGDGSQTRSFCYVTDLIDGIIRLLDCNVHQPVNLGNPNEITIHSFARMIQKITESESEITYHELPEGDPQRRKPDITRARDQLDWDPRVPLEEGLERTLPYFRSKINGDSPE